ncbi:hypothetical protein WBG99_11860 [Streptomyces sp. TG1A-60]|uniref:hypothetical protein n=1 Tax=Streptomyces sp. TG1A-60 TaxID=3129111 RepID=UPI0030D4971F
MSRFRSGVWRGGPVGDRGGARVAVVALPGCQRARFDRARPGTPDLQAITAHPYP